MNHNYICEDATASMYIKKNSKSSYISDYDDRPWGEYWVYDTGVTNKNRSYDKKVLKVKANNSDRPRCLSLQFHGTDIHQGHDEVWKAITDIVVVIGTRSMVGLSKQEIEHEINFLKVIKVKKNDLINIPNGFLHALVNPYDTPVYLAEVRTSQGIEDSNQRESNITRILDEAMRDGCAKFTDELIKKIKIVM